MGSFVAEAGTDVSLGREKAKNGDENHFTEIKPGTEGDQQGVKSPPMHGKNNPNELPSLRILDGQKVDEHQDPLQDWEPDYVQKCNGNPDSQVYENGDGDLPSFSIRRLRRLPLRVSSDQLPSALAAEAAVDQNQPDDDRAEELVLSEDITDNRNSSPVVLTAENIEQRQTLPDPSAGDAAHSSGDPVSSFDSSRSKDGVEVSAERPLNVLEEGGNQVSFSGGRNGGNKGREPELENGKLAIEEPEFRNPGSGVLGGTDKSPVRRVNDELSSEREDQAGNDLVQGIAEGNKDSFAASEQHASNSANALEGEGGNSRLPQSHDSYVSSPNPEVEHTAPVLQQVDDLVQQDVSSPETSDFLLSPSAGLGGVSDKESIRPASPAPVVDDPNRDGDGQVREYADLEAPTKPAELPSPGVVQILPPVMGSRFGSPGETTDEETDSPRSSEGFSYPDSDVMPLPSSGQIMYPSRFSCAQSSNGPSLLQYSGSMSLRSDSSTTSNRSFAFPILAPPEWNSSPARMAKAHPRRKNRFDGCCFFRLSRSRYKY